MNVKFENNNVILENAEDFKISDIFDCGQCFRWNRQEDGTYVGVAMGRALCISQSDKEIVFHSTTKEDFENLWHNYFDLDRNYSKIRKILAVDSSLSSAFAFGGGIRILRQSFWECLVSFIISASNNIPRIKKIVELLCENFGEKIIYMQRDFHTFPSPEKIAELSLEDLAKVRAGFRDKYILDAARKFVSDPQMSEEYLRKCSADEAKKILMRINGVGNKVADCVLLFGLGKYECFPVDVWMKRIMEYCYFNGTNQDIKTIQNFATEHFGKLGGFAQQYLFFYARENKIGV